MGREYFCAYHSFLESLEPLTDAEKGRLFVACLEYSKSGIMPELRGNEKFVFPTLRGQIDRDRIKIRCGENHPNWKGGITRQNTKDRNSSEYNNWRKSVFERDNYTCQVCGKIGGSINAHHIKHFAKYKNLRLEISNGITLCITCHKKAHRSKP